MLVWVGSLGRSRSASTRLNIQCRLSSSDCYDGSSPPIRKCESISSPSIHANSLVSKHWTLVEQKSSAKVVWVDVTALSASCVLVSMIVFYAVLDHSMKGGTTIMVAASHLCRGTAYEGSIAEIITAQPPWQTIIACFWGNVSIHFRKGSVCMVIQACRMVIVYITSPSMLYNVLERKRFGKNWVFPPDFPASPQKKHSFSLIFTFYYKIEYIQ